MPGQYAVRLKTWLHDWFWGSSTLPSEKTVEVNGALLAQAGALVAYPFAGDLLNLLPATLPPERTILLRAVLSIAMLWLANRVVTAKDPVPQVAGWNEPAPAPRYRYRSPEGERLLSKMAAALLVFLWALIYWPTWETPACRVSATVEVVSPERGKPVFIAILAGNRELGRRSADAGQTVALDIPGMHISEWSLMIGWSDGSQSSFGALSSCPGELVSSSHDGKAKILLRQR